ncbi:helix-turn-helix domain-containing protein [Streptomyces albogriseolus]|uniref:helix-turn-helix domain-containing protein n=1 Tax=Streptomyces albogriseolus TaxID=1887 RepID=UPI0037A67354
MTGEHRLSARAALGARLRELRFTCPGSRLTGQQLAQRLGWPGSKVSKLENGRQTATPEDLPAWADATEQPGVYPELAARLAGFESHIRSWRRALANGFKPLHEGLSAEIDRASDVWIWKESVIAGLLQTPEYARHVVQRYSELLDDADNIALYKKVWKTLSESAVYGADAHNLINSARRSLNPR